MENTHDISTLAWASPVDASARSQQLCRFLSQHILYEHLLVLLGTNLHPEHSCAALYHGGCTILRPSTGRVAVLMSSASSTCDLLRLSSTPPVSASRFHALSLWFSSGGPVAM